MSRFDDEALAIATEQSAEPTKPRTIDSVETSARGLYARAEEILGEALATTDLRVALQAIREARACLELVGKVTGEIDASTKVQINTISVDVARMTDAELRAHARALLGDEPRQPGKLGKHEQARAKLPAGDEQHGEHPVAGDRSDDSAAITVAGEEIPEHASGAEHGDEHGRGAEGAVQQVSDDGQGSRDEHEPDEHDEGNAGHAGEVSTWP